MTVYVVRHSLAVPKKQWTGKDHDRPLNKRGWAQSKVLTKSVTGAQLDSVLSSPSLRCLDTVGGIATTHDLPVITRQELAIGDGQVFKEFVVALLAGDADTLVCTHGENILPVLRGLRPATISGPKSGVAKGSVWTLTPSPHGIVASYTTNTELARRQAGSGKASSQEMTTVPQPVPCPPSSP